MHKPLLLFTLAFLSLYIANGQNIMDSQGTIGDFGYITLPANKNNAVKGSPYITKDFVPAKISVLKNRVYPVKYNALMDEIVVMGEDDATYGLDKHGRRDITITLLGSKNLIRYLTIWTTVILRPLGILFISLRSTPM